MNNTTKKEVINRLVCLYNSCAEGITGEWDCSEDGFTAMQDDIEFIALSFGVNLTEQYPLKDNNVVCKTCNRTDCKS